MDKQKFKKLRLSLLFALIVFAIMLVAILIVFAVAALLFKIGLLQRGFMGRLPIFYFSIVSLITGTIIAFFISGKPLKPLREIMEATDRIADGDYSVRIDLKGPEEFRQLSDRFNHMAEELDSVEMLRSDFVGNFSHEFKTPIVSIRGFAKALKWDDLTDEERDEYLDIIIDESERLSALSTNVLYLSKVEKQTILTDKKRLNLAEQLRLAIALLDKKISEKNLTVEFDSGEVYSEGNEEMLKQVWINLLDNAIKFSPENDTVRVSLSEDEDKVSVRISNEGTGISDGARAHIFDKFYQGDASHSTSGNGLGLAIVKKIVELHEGSVDLVPTETGTTFEVKI